MRKWKWESEVIGEKEWESVQNLSMCTETLESIRICSKNCKSMTNILKA
jgi:hypothetical protein